MLLEADDLTYYTEVFLLCTLYYCANELPEHLQSMWVHLYSLLVKANRKYTRIGKLLWDFHRRAIFDISLDLSLNPILHFGYYEQLLNVKVVCVMQDKTYWLTASNFCYSNKNKSSPENTYIDFTAVLVHTTTGYP